MEVEPKVVFISILTQLRVIKQKDKHTSLKQLKVLKIFGHMYTLDMIMMVVEHMVH
jgi:hypothetical protein